MRPILWTTDQIIRRPWKKEIIDQKNSTTLPIPPSWKESTPMTINDVNFWEQLYYKIGTVGIYVSWQPYEEFYIIVYNLFSHIEQGIESFYGPTAYADVQTKANSLGIELKPTQVWVS